MSPRTSHLLQIQSLYWKNRSFLPTVVDQPYHEYYDYHDFEGAVEDFPGPCPEWTFDPSIGIVHAQDCSICRSYAKHVIIANHSSEDSFKKALSAREKRVTATFSDGVHAGRILQQEHDSLQLACYREERDKALYSVEQKTKILDTTGKEVQSLRDQVLALQSTIDELLARRNNDEVVQVAGSPESDISLMELNSSVEADDVDVLSTPPSTPTDDYTISALLDAPMPDAGSLQAEEAPDSSSVTPAFAGISDASNAKALQPSEPATSPPKPATHPPCQPQLSSKPPKPFSVRHPTRSVPTTVSKSSRRFTTLAQLQAATEHAYKAVAGMESVLASLKSSSQLTLKDIVNAETLTPDLVSVDVFIASDGSFVETASGPAAREIKRHFNHLYGVGLSVRSPYAITGFVNQHGKPMFRVGNRELSAPGAAGQDAEGRSSEAQILAKSIDPSKAAHGGDHSSLTALRAFKASAHEKSPHRRTKQHRCIMKHWREPPTSHAPASSVRTTLDGDTFSTEIYVDASQRGIGFVMDGLWFAWKFADSITATLSGSQIDINWAEMIAVEVGLWTVIQWVCRVIQKEGGDLKSLEILVRSDNAGVVRAIERRHTNHSLQQDILRRILDMVSEHGLKLTMKWISSTDNLADKTSRGVPGRVADMLPFVPALPSHLSDILGPISSNN